MNSDNRPSLVTHLFTDIEGSTRLWEEEPERMHTAQSCHDGLLRNAVQANHGVVVKMTGDGMHAAFDDPLEGVNATISLLQALSDPASMNGFTLQVRCGLHVGIAERRANDYFGSAVNRAARIMSAAHGGQVLLSQAAAALITDRLPSHITLRDLGSVRLRDLARAEHLYQILHPQLRQDFPMLRTLEATPNNLPQQVTSFIGRERELNDVKKLLSTSRLLTVLGVGGIGKTRLSLQVAADVIDQFPDGVWFVELASLTDARSIPQAAASALGVKEEPGRPVIEALVKYVKDRQLLIVLDNCEHLLLACAGLAKQLHQAGSRLKVLASSREHLHIVGEATYQLPALAVPDPSNQVTPDALVQCEGVRLFVERAATVQPSFQLTQENAAAVAQICRHLDGIPLAIELAAARVRALSVENIAARLNDRFRLLTGGDRTALPRQQTLRALMDWSYDLLAEPERTLLRRLVVFAGSWTLEGAEAIAAGDDLDRADVLELLTRLVEKSLVMLEADGERYRLLETVRQYAQERLNESEEGDHDGEARESTERAHALYFLRVLAQLRRAVEDGDREALQLVDTEFENCRMAWRWSHRHEATDAVTKSAATVLHFCDHRGRFEEGLSLLRDTLESQPARADANLSALLMAAAAHLEYRLDRYANAEATAERALAASRPGDHETHLQCLKVLGSCCLRLGRHADAQRYFKQALQQATASVDPHNAAAVLDNLALVEKAMGHYAEALRLSIRSLVQHQRLGDFAGEALCLNNLAVQYLDKQEYESAGAHLRHGLAICERHGLVSTRGLILANLAEFAMKTGDNHSAETYAKRALEVAEATGNRAIACFLKLQFVHLALQRGDLTAARSDLGSSLGIAIAIGRPYLLLAGVSSFAEILAAQGEMECARLALAFAADHPSMTAQGRDEMRARLAQWQSAASAESPWPALELDELVHRIVVESNIAHAPLIAALRGAH